MTLDGTRPHPGSTVSVCPLCPWWHEWPDVASELAVVGFPTVDDWVEAVMTTRAHRVETAIRDHYAHDHQLYGIEEIETEIRATHERENAGRRLAGLPALTRDEWTGERARLAFRHLRPVEGR